jgi:hypothetical protein
MSSVASSKSNLSAKGSKTNFKSMFDVGATEENPFKCPEDEKIFTFKEEEKQRRLAERETNHKLKIWEKNRPAREGCLRKICETDIEPSALAINPKVQKKINIAETAGMTIPVERQRNKESRHKLIEKKREMALVQ